MTDQERFEQHTEILVDAIAKVAGTAMAFINNLHPDALREALLIALAADCKLSHGMTDDEVKFLTDEIREFIDGRILDAARNRN